MKLTSIFAIAAVAAMSGFTQPAFAEQAAGVTSHEASAAKQKRSRHSHARKRHQSYPAYRAYGAADPSFDRSGRPYRPTVQGPCMVDLGYGRFARCDAGY